MAAVPRARAQGIVDGLPEVERTDNPIGYYYLIRGAQEARGITRLRTVGLTHVAARDASCA